LRLDRVQPGDIVQVAIKGRTGIYGEVTEVSRGVVYFRPISPGAGWRHAAAHEVVAHWRRSGRRGARSDEESDLPAAPREQLSLPIHT
jgi:hypothetical protein